MQHICGVKECERYKQDCPFGSIAIDKINVDQKFQLNLKEFPYCLMPPVITNDPKDGIKMEAKTLRAAFT